MKEMFIFPKVGSSVSWPAPPELLMLKNDEVHIWRASLEMTPCRVKTLEQLLSTDELGRAERFHFQKDRDHFVAARGILRLILGRYLLRRPKKLLFCYGPTGKPELAGEAAGRAIGFNVSHSHGLALFAITSGRQVGVDLEYIREDFSVGDLINELFSPGEILACKALPPDEQQRTFFLWWTRKEAWLKARGSGLALDPRDIDLSRLRAISGMLPEIYEDGRGLALYSVTDVDASDRFAAALAVEGHCWQLKCWQWESSLLCSGTDMIY